MSKSLKRVMAVLADAGLPDAVIETGTSRTAPEAAKACGCDLDQIVKSLIFRGADTGRICLFLTAGGNRIAADKAAQLAGEALERADPAQVRAVTGFAIGGVAPVGHLSPSPTWMDPRLMDFAKVWAAAGTPQHVFAIAPDRLAALSSAALADFVE